MDRPLVILNVVGLSQDLLGENTPSINRFISQGTQSRLKTVLPAVTCSVQSSILTGKKPSEHGIVGNGWYFRDLSQVWLWRQSNRLVQSPPFWEKARESRSELKVAKLFWWYNMYSSADISVTPRPSYMADGRKIPDIYTQPYSLREELQSELGQFPLFRFWGPMADITSTQWIADSARYIYKKEEPHITLIYLPHLDYNLQRLGPDHPDVAEDIREIDKLVGRLIDFYEDHQARIVLLSEYAILPVRRPIFINQALRREGFISVHHNYVGEILDCGKSRAFALADHQIAHIYLADDSDIEPLRELIGSLPGVDWVKRREELSEIGLNHPRSGELVALAESDSWFTYYYWLKEENAPDFARTVDIHQKPGYDPVELFFDPEMPFLKARLLGKLMAKKMGFRTLMDVIPLRPELVGGSHGRITDKDEPAPVFLTNLERDFPGEISALDLFSLFLELALENS